MTKKITNKKIARKITQQKRARSSVGIQGKPGKVAMHATKPLNTQRELPLLFSGVAIPCLEIAKTRSHTTTLQRAHYVAVISNGTAVWGLKS